MISSALVTSLKVKGPENKIDGEFKKKNEPIMAPIDRPTILLKPEKGCKSNYFLMTPKAKILNLVRKIILGLWYLAS